MWITEKISSLNLEQKFSQKSTSGKQAKKNGVGFNELCGHNGPIAKSNVGWVTLSFSQWACILIKA